MPDTLEKILSHPTRVQRLRQLAILDSLQEEAFDALSRLATMILDAPTALVTIVDTDRQFFKSCIGLPEPWNSTRETPLSHSFCKHVVATAEPLVIDDAREHPVVKDNLAIRDMNVIAYLGIPLVLSDGIGLGSFCVIDTKPRHWTEREVRIMTDLAGRVTTELELRDELLRRRLYEERQLKVAVDREQDRLIKQFLQGTAHEFRTPLSIIKTKTHILNRTLESDDAKEHLTAINDAVDDLAQLISKITTPSNTREKFESASQQYNLNTLLQVVAEEKGPHLTTKQLTLEFELDDSIDTICCEPYQLSLAIGHILDNAIDYNKPGGRIIVESFQKENTVFARIEDTGIGMTDEILPHIFERFFRGDRARTQRGLGLGLSIAQTIIERQQGDIHVESSAGEGTIVTIAMPISPDC